MPFTIEVDGANFTIDATVFWTGKPLFHKVHEFPKASDIRSTNLMLSGMVPVYVRTSGLNSNPAEFDLH